MSIDLTIWRRDDREYGIFIGSLNVDEGFGIFIGSRNIEVNGKNNIHKEQTESNGDDIVLKKEEPIKDTLILYVAADSSVADEILNKRKLSPDMASDLYVKTMKMWYGAYENYENSLIKKEFSRAETTDDFAKGYDYYVMRFSLKNNYNGGERGIRGEREEFFVSVCQEMPQLEEVSKRLCFDEDFSTEAYDKD
jgi:hypothetical protein